MPLSKSFHFSIFFFFTAYITKIPLGYKIFYQKFEKNKNNFYNFKSSEEIWQWQNK